MLTRPMLLIVVALGLCGMAVAMEPLKGYKTQFEVVKEGKKDRYGDCASQLCFILHTCTATNSVKKHAVVGASHANAYLKAFISKNGVCEPPKMVPRADPHGGWTQRCAARRSGDGARDRDGQGDGQEILEYKGSSCGILYAAIRVCL